MVVVVAGDGDVDRGAEAVGKAAEDVRDHLRRQVANRGRVEAAVELGEGATRQVDQHLRFGLVHRQREAEAADAALVAERLAKRGAERDGDILDAVVGVDLGIALARQRQREAAVRGDLVEHMVVKGNAAVDVARAVAVEIEAEGDAGFPGIADDRGGAGRP